MASIGGVIKYYLALTYYITYSVWWGINLYFCLCLLTPIVGAVLGWVIAMVVQKVSSSKWSALIGGLLSGIITTLVLTPIPYIPQ